MLDAAYCKKLLILYGLFRTNGCQLRTAAFMTTNVRHVKDLYIIEAIMLKIIEFNILLRYLNCGISNDMGCHLLNKYQ